MHSNFCTPLLAWGDKTLALIISVSLKYMEFACKFISGRGGTEPLKFSGGVSGVGGCCWVGSVGG